MHYPPVAGWDHTWAPTIGEHMGQFGLEEVDAESFRRYMVGGDIGSVRINEFSLGVLCDLMVGTGRIMSIRSMPTWHAYATPRWDTSALRQSTRGVGGPSLHRSTLESERKGVGNSVATRVSNLTLLMKHVVPQARTHRSRLAQ